VTDYRMDDLGSIIRGELGKFSPYSNWLQGGCMRIDIQIKGGVALSVK
jgi:hypothetical protein